MADITQKARQIRDVIRYIKAFKNAVTVIYIDDEIVNSPMLPSHIHDINLIHESGIKVVIVPGCRKRINEILTQSKIDWQIKNGERITSSDAMPLIKMAAFDVSNIIMTSLAAERKSAVIGNWVKARGIGIIDGVDYGTTGKIDSIATDSIKEILDDGFIPILPCIGWSAAGKPYNISSLNLATEIAINLKADKLFFVLPNTELDTNVFRLPENVNLSEEKNIPALNLSELDAFLTLNDSTLNTSTLNDTKNSKNSNIFSDFKRTKSGAKEFNSQQAESLQNGEKRETEITSKKNENSNKILHLFELAKNACKNNVSRVHILDGFIDGIIPAEIFSSIGSGTMIYNDEYSGFRKMTLDDVSSVLSLMSPFIEKGILLPRTKQSLQDALDDYVVYQVDGAIHACAALKKYNLSEAEIAGVAVDESYSKLGIGLKLMNYLIKEAKMQKLKSVFVLTTQTADWFEKQGFIEDLVSSLPEERQKLWTPERNSKVLRLKI